MPRGRKKGRRIAESHQASDEDYDTGDTGSIISGTSDVPSIINAAEGGDEVDEISAQEEFEDKLKDCIDGTSQKSVKGRCECLQGLKAALSKKYLYEFVLDRKMTITDSIERCLKKGKGEEQALASMCGVLLCLQLGAGDDSEDVYRALRPILNIIIQDASASTKARSGCAMALGLIAFIASGDLLEALEIMKTLENIFRASYLKGDGTTPSHSPEIAALHNNALLSWTLLLTIAPPTVIQDLIESHLDKISEIYLGSGPCIINPGENYAYILYFSATIVT